jgi:predicted DNA-binding helix-hairpin-helix protein
MGGGNSAHTPGAPDAARALALSGDAVRRRWGRRERSGNPHHHRLCDAAAPLAARLLFRLQHPSENPWREHRLYQASLLLRDYGFALADLPFTPESRLPLEVDPKLGWAQAHLHAAPVEIHCADRHELLRVPGIGPKGADAILRARRHGTFRDLSDLQRLGVLANRAAPFILLNGKSPVQQLSLFA